MRLSNLALKSIGALALCALFPSLGDSPAVFAAPVSISTALDAHSSGLQETGFGDLAADAVLSAAPTSDFALVPAGELHSVSVPAGQSSTDVLVQALRTGNDTADTIVVMKLTGAQVRAALAHGLSREPSPYDGFLQVSGLTVTYDPAKHGDQRVEKVTVANTQSPLDSAATYRVAMPRYLADGSLGYFELWSGAAAYTSAGTSLASALASYVTAHQPLVSPIPGNRIVADKS